MTITAARFASAMTPEQYMTSMDQNRDQFAANIAAVKISEDERSFFSELPAPLRVLVLSEAWCPDCTTNVPIIVRLAQVTGGLEVRMLKREGNEDLANQYTLADGRNHIPTYVVLGLNNEEVGTFIERPAAVTEQLALVRQSWYAEHPELDPAAPLTDAPADLRTEFQSTYSAARRGLWDLEQRETIAAFRAIAERVYRPVAR